MPMSEAIAAVLDGVLVDSESVWDAARREVVARNGGRWQADAMWAMMGMSSPEWSRYLHDQLGVPLKPEQINALVIAALLDQFRRRLPLLPGAVVAVRRLADRWPLGLASSANRPVIDTVLKQAGITDCFAVTVSGEEVAAGTDPPLSPAEREQRYQQVLRELRDPKFYQIRITGMLLKRGYLWPNERDDLNALRQAVILFISDTLRKTPKPNRKAEDKEIVERDDRR
jgi:FMN phosphatase YigB (HAD superfamily)